MDSIYIISERNHLLTVGVTQLEPSAHFRAAPHANYAVYAQCPPNQTQSLLQVFLHKLGMSKHIEARGNGFVAATEDSARTYCA